MRLKIGYESFGVGKLLQVTNVYKINNKNLKGSKLSKACIEYDETVVNSYEVVTDVLLEGVQDFINTDLDSIEVNE